MNDIIVLICGVIISSPIWIPLGARLFCFKHKRFEEVVVCHPLKRNK